MADANGWIKVSELLPDEDVPVWVHDGKGQIWIGGRSIVDDCDWAWCNCYHSIYQDSDGSWKANNIEWDDNYTVVEWQPLPSVTLPPPPVGDEK